MAEAIQAVITARRLSMTEPLALTVTLESADLANELAAEVLAAHWDERLGAESMPAWLEDLERAQEHLADTVRALRQMFKCWPVLLEIRI